jgi:S-DNA-T family DNA segregation ATPase FtsK/SpoIIIE
LPKSRKKIKAGPERALQSFDWSLDPQTGKEIVSLLSFAFGLLLILSIFNSAGTFGQQAFKILNDILGIAYVIAPIVLFTTSIVLWRGREVKLKGPTVLGLIMLFIFVPALFGIFSNGGWLGNSVGHYFISLFGIITAFVITICLIIISALLATNLSIKEVKAYLFGQSEKKEEEETAVPLARVSVFQTVKDRLSSRQPSAPDNTQVPVMPIKVAPKIVSDKNWILPPIDLLPTSTLKADPGNISKNVEIIQKSLKDFGIDVTMGDVNIGPTVAQYTLKPTEGVKLTAITSRANDLALALAARSIRIEAPIPGKSAVGIEIPNKVPAIVTLREILTSPEYKAMKSNLSIALGRDVAGKAFIADIAKMPHLLVAGSTGAGKSVAINGMILSLLFANSPADLRMILVDPKRVEFTRYNGIPHLLTNVVTEVDKIVNTLRWTVAEMERRYKVFADSHHRNIEEYNAKPTEGHLPYIVVVIDELADLMMQAAGEVEASIVRISQLARATGIHLIVATQRPSVNVITGLIKANIATRIAFAVASQIDSRTILDQAGAEQLLGKGDMLYLGNEIGKPKRVQGALIGEKEITAVTDFLKRDGEATYDDSIQEFRAANGRSGNGGEQGEDDLYDEAKEVVVGHGKASASLLQRRLRVGYNRAARLLDMLENDGIIGPAEGAKPRDVLINPDQLESSPPPTSGPTYYQPSPTQSTSYDDANRIKPFPSPGEIEIQGDEDEEDI